ncbi:beta-1,3-galactosyltransferase 2-like [Centropristis striata]|uniref:beta-1,3-galactosyltransferase 2-like n=1 Tax=Centropristis striata TaxID=184440 RepID=UPI0027E09A9F|nr:beta-1,3-galactosyltransferase 2-like [Centropristis striata]XP_059184615.1 beta-1,3-galactosyltransferase 2-like [Centropristis striata]
MENRKRCFKIIFFCILVAATLLFIYLNRDWDSMSRETEVQWEDPGPYHVAYPRNYKFIMDDTPTCKSTTPFLVLMVPVAPHNVKARDIIRKTWGSEKLVLGKLVETVFVLGLPGGAHADQQQLKLQVENLEYHDMIQANFQDSYRNLTIKTMMMVEWLAANCGKASYVIKIDSDVFLHVQNLVKLLLNPTTPKQNYMTGLVWWHSPVLRNPFDKFYMPRDVIAESEYPPYPLGFAYVMSLDLPAKILTVSPQIKPIFIEDAYLSMCLKRLSISPTDPPEKTMFLVIPTHPLSSCSLSKVIASTTTSIQLMTSYWQRSSEPGAKC